jgi:amino acid transporter
VDEFQFQMLQEQLWIAFGYAVQWWLILFLVLGVLVAAIVFTYVMLSRWMEKS